MPCFFILSIGKMFIRKIKGKYMCNSKYNAYICDKILAVKIIQKINENGNSSKKNTSKNENEQKNY